MVDLALAYKTAMELAILIRQKQLSPIEAIENSLQRITVINQALNAFCLINHDQALADAREAERAVMRGDEIGPLHGVPIAIKDVTPTRDLRTTMGSFAFEHWIPEFDAVVVERLRRAGAILVGKTTTPEFATGFITRSPLFGTTRNPWNSDRTSGGSSGGSAVAVATGCVPLAEGSDMGGSIRSPASYCGIVGLKPSFGRIPFEIFPSIFDQTPHFGPLARTIDDAALFLHVAKGADDRDIQSFLPDLPVSLPVPPDVLGMRLAFSPDLGYCVVSPEARENARTAAALLREHGAIVEEIDVGLSHTFEAAGGVNSAACHAAMWADLLPKWRGKMSPSVLRRIDRGLQISGVELKRTEFVRSELWKKLRPIFAKYNALLCPTTTTPVPPAEAAETDFNYVDDSGRYHGIELTFPFNLVGQCPALSVPSGFFSDGMPTGLQIVGRVHDELTILKIGAALEKSLQWTNWRPPI